MSLAPYTHRAQRIAKAVLLNAAVLYILVLQKVPVTFARSVENLSEPYSYMNMSTHGSDVHILLVSSVRHQKTYVAALMQTMFHNFHVTSVSENDIPECLLCGTQPGEATLAEANIKEERMFQRNEGKRKAKGKAHYSGKKESHLSGKTEHHFLFGKSMLVPSVKLYNSPDWYCAQQRNLQALAKYIKSNTLPKWLFLVDDDAFINPEPLLRTLHSLNSDQEHVYGHSKRGGAGFIFSNAALLALARPAPLRRFSWSGENWTGTDVFSMVDLCVRHHVGGYWCYQHSDHVIGTCLEALNISISRLGRIGRDNLSWAEWTRAVMSPLNSRDAMVQDCPIGPKRLGSWYEPLGFWTDEDYKQYDSIKESVKRRSDLNKTRLFFEQTFSYGALSAEVLAFLKYEMVSCHHLLVDDIHFLHDLQHDRAQMNDNHEAGA